MAKTRKSRAGSRAGSRPGIFSFLMKPVSALLKGTKGVVRKGANTARNVVSRGINGIDSVSRTVTGAANSAVRNVNPFRGRKSRKSSRRNRRR